MARHDTERRNANGAARNGTPLPFLDEVPDAMRSYFDWSAELQSEFLNLWSHRAQAWLNWPKQMLGCKTPGDMNEVQTRFMTTMQRHYRDYFDSVLKDSLIRAEPIQEETSEGPAGPGKGSGSDRPQSRSEDHRKAA